MPGTIIYLHGALDAGFGFVSQECKSGGAIRNACAAHGFTLRNPVAEGNPLPLSWHKGPLLREIDALTSGAGGPFYLAGHSLGGRGALLIGLRHALGAQRFKAIGAIGPAFGQGLDGVPLASALSVFGSAVFSEPFSCADARQALAASTIPAFLGFTPLDLVVNLQTNDLAGVHNPAAHRVVRNYGVTPLPLDPHNALISVSANDLMSFFASIP